MDYPASMPYTNAGFMNTPSGTLVSYGYAPPRRGPQPPSSRDMATRRYKYCTGRRSTGLYL
jgi:hypothetical protein